MQNMQQIKESRNMQQIKQKKKQHKDSYKIGISLWLSKDSYELS